MSFILEDKYAQIMELMPILCVDAVLRNSKGQYLLVKRANEPLKGQWWVIGGRVLKGETLKQAVIRKIKEEAGFIIDSVKPIGYYEEVAHVNRFGSSTPLHTVSVVFSAIVDESVQIKLDNQSTDWKYSSKLPKDFSIKLREI